jgi:hypothetical protein
MIGRKRAVLQSGDVQRPNLLSGPLLTCKQSHLKPKGSRENVAIAFVATLHGTFPPNRTGKSILRKISQAARCLITCSFETIKFNPDFVPNKLAVAGVEIVAGPSRRLAVIPRPRH